MVPSLYNALKSALAVASLLLGSREPSLGCRQTEKAARREGESDFGRTTEARPQPIPSGKGASFPRLKLRRILLCVS